MPSEIELKQIAALRYRGIISEDEALEYSKKADELDFANSSFNRWGAFSTETWPSDLVVEPFASTILNPAAMFGPGKNASSLMFGGNSAIYACINTVATAFMEAPLVVQERILSEEGQSRWSIVEKPPIGRLLRAPNRSGPDETYPVAIPMPHLGWLAQWQKHVDGNAYWLKIRAGDPLTGNVIAVWPLCPSMTKPVGPKLPDGLELPAGLAATIENWITHYEYDPLPGIVSPIRIDPRNIVHFKLGVDPTNPRLGIGPVKFLAREIAAEALATQFVNALLRNSAIPGLIVVPAEGYVDEDQANEIKKTMRREFTGGNQGGVAVLSAGATVNQFGHDPDKMQMAGIYKHCEERIAAVMNVPAIVAQLGAGIEQSAQFSNFHEAREMMAENTMLPLYTADGETLTGQLLPDFDENEDRRLRYDVEQIRALQQDSSNLFGRLQIAVRGGWLTANEARAQVGLAPIDEKKQQVPLTQGEDNRFNELVTLGLVTLNEVRESVGLPPRPDGEQLIKDLAPPPPAPPGPEGSPEGNATPGEEGGPQLNQKNTRGSDEKVPDGKRPGAAAAPKGKAPSTGPQAQTPSKSQMLQLAFKMLELDEIAEMSEQAAARGMTFADLLATKEMEAMWADLLDESIPA